MDGRWVTERAKGLAMKAAVEIKRDSLIHWLLNKETEEANGKDSGVAAEDSIPIDCSRTDGEN
jgi:hypothetical protein